MKLPDGEHAVVDIQKLTEYSLDPHHPDGQHKARVFASALGLLRSDAEFLRQELLRAAAEGEAVQGRTDAFGVRYTIDFVIVRRSREATVRSAWMVAHDVCYPRLITCFVLLR
jgi:hypothetical protein